MDTLRRGFDGFYDFISPTIFKVTKNKPKIAHGLFVKFLGGLRFSGLSEVVLDNESNYIETPYKISNAAGFVKNAEINPRDMRLLGFDRVVVGTITGEKNIGNPGKTMWRFPESGSMVNWDGWSNEGVERVSRRLLKYGDHRVPLTINLGVTPGKSGNEALDDLEKTVLSTREIPFVERYELNISCLNVCGGFVDMNRLCYMLDVVRENMNPSQDLYLKVSPDLDESEVDGIVRAGEVGGVCGYIISNTTRNHDSKYIPISPGRGGGSGDVVYELSKKTQELFSSRIGDDVDIIACGGINSVARANERTSIGNCSEIQIFTPVIFEGTGLLRELREG